MGVTGFPRRPNAWCAALGVAVLLTSCSEELTAPGNCPDYCSPYALTMIDTVLTDAIAQDSSFGRPVGYVSPHDAVALVATSVPGRESRPIFRTLPIPSRVVIDNDTATGVVVGVDSLRLTLTIVHRDTAAHNLTLALYALPLSIDSATAFHDLDAAFAGPVVRSINLDSLLAKPGLKDPVTGDSVDVEILTNRITLIIGLDSAQAPLVVADSGKLAFGIRVSADSLASVSLGTSPDVTWFLSADSLGLKTVHRVRQAQASFDSFVFDPPAQPIGSSLVVGGVPSARTMLRMALPRVIRDSSRVIRATLLFVSAAPLEGSAADSFPVIAYPVIADFGAKSPLSPLRNDTTWITIAPHDTVRIEVTNVLTLWTVDPRQQPTLMLVQRPEGAVFAELRFHSSADFALRPMLHITYAPRYPVHP